VQIRWLILLSLTLARTAMAFQFQLVPALSAIYIGELGLSYAAFGALAGVYLLPGVVAALFGGWLGSRFGDIQTALAGLALMAAGGFAGAFLTGFETQMAARIVAGAGAVGLNVMLTKMAGDWFQGRPDFPTAMGILVSSWPAGIALAMLALPAVAASFGGTVALLTAPCLAAAALILLATVWRAPDRAGETPAVRGASLTGAEFRLILVSGCLWALYNVAFITFIVWAPQALSAGTGRAESAAAVVSLVGWTTILSVSVGGWLASRTRRRDTVPLASFALSALLVAGFGLAGTGSLAPIYMVLVGLALGPAAGLIMTLPIEATRREVRAFAMGLFLALYYGLMGIAPSFMGALLDITGNPSAPIMAASALFLSCIALWRLFRAIQRRPPDRLAGGLGPRSAAG
jgi:MFS family permease